MAVHHSTPQLHPLFSQFLYTRVGHEIRRFDSILAQVSSITCQFEEDQNPFGCGAQATVTDLESERDYCLNHFQAINLPPIRKPDAFGMSRTFNADAVNTTDLVSR